MPTAYFSRQGDRLAPAPHAASPWSQSMVHGRLFAGLAARAVEAEAHGFQVARLTVDLFRPAPMSPFAMTASVVRSGQRVRAVDVSIVCGEAEVARSSAILLRPSSHPEQSPWVAGAWDVPRPEDLEPDWPPDRGGWEIRPITPGGFASAVRKQVWTRDTGELVEGEPLTPLVRLALSADLPNPLANASETGLEFINADLTLSVGRPPESDWIGLEVTDHIGHDGIAIGLCTMHDTEGPVGWSSVSALANGRMGT